MQLLFQHFIRLLIGEQGLKKTYSIILVNADTEHGWNWSYNPSSIYSFFICRHLEKQRKRWIKKLRFWITKFCIVANQSLWVHEIHTVLFKWKGLEWDLLSLLKKHEQNLRRVIELDSGICKCQSILCC